MCKRVVPDWPADEIGYLEEHGWTVLDGMWLEPLAHVQRLPTAAMIAEQMSLVAQQEAVLASQPGEYWRRDKIIPDEIRKGLEKARAKLASLRAGEPYEARQRQRLSQPQAVQMQYIRDHPYEVKTRDVRSPCYSKDELSLWERQALARYGKGVLEKHVYDAMDRDAQMKLIRFLPEHERHTIEDRRKATIVSHKQMCTECRQF
jgi:hypothetical protein